MRDGAGADDLYIEIIGTPGTPAPGVAVGIALSDGTPVCNRTLGSDYTMRGASVIFADEMNCGGTPWPTAGVASITDRSGAPVSTRAYNATGGKCGLGYQPVGGNWVWSTPGPGRAPGEPVRDVAPDAEPGATEELPDAEPAATELPQNGCASILLVGGALAVVFVQRRGRQG